MMVWCRAVSSMIEVITVALKKCPQSCLLISSIAELCSPMEVL
jgi:hypothetical protein